MVNEAVVKRVNDPNTPPSKLIQMADSKFSRDPEIRNVLRQRLSAEAEDRDSRYAKEAQRVLRTKLAEE